MGKDVIITDNVNNVQVKSFDDKFKNSNPRKKFTLVLTNLNVILAILIIIAFSIMIYNSYHMKQLPQDSLGANIEKVVIDTESNKLYIRLKSGIDTGTIESVKFYIDNNGEEIVYETSLGTDKLSVSMKKGFFNKLFNKRFSGEYDYILTSADLGIDNFDNLKNIRVTFIYRVKDGNLIESEVLDSTDNIGTGEINDTSNIDNKTTQKVRPSGGGGGGGGGSVDTGIVNNCGDGTCNSDENCMTCNADCGVCPVVNASSLVGWWRLEGDASDSSGNGLDGVFNGNIDLVVDPERQVIADMDGDGDYVSVGDDPLIQLNDEISFGAWMNPDVYGLYYWDRVLYKADDSDNAYQIATRGDGGERKIICAVDKNGLQSIASTSSLSVGWHHIMCIYDSLSGVTLYVDGVVDTNPPDGGNSAGVNTESSDFFIGRRDDGDATQYVGLIDDVRIYNKTLSSSDIQNIIDEQPLVHSGDASCGNRIVEGSEECDDGNDVSGDGCSSCVRDCADTCLSLRIGCGVETICGEQVDCGKCLDRINPGEYTSIKGIPKPSFGVDETHYMYESMTYDFGSGPEAYKTWTDGPYTHYIDMNHPNATDVSNPFGTINKPRLTIPSSLSPGSVVEIHGGDYGSSSFIANGDSTHPIFVRGVEGEEPVVINTFRPGPSSYLIIENIDFDRKGQTREAVNIGDQIGSYENISIRYNEVHNSAYSAPTGEQMIQVQYAHNSLDVIKDIVVFNNHIHNCGEGRTAKRDIGGVWVGQNTENIWVIDNHIHHIGGDSVPIMTASNNQPWVEPDRIYVGRNDMHDNFENAIDLKTGKNIIISENIMHDFGRVDGSGPAIVFHGSDYIEYPHQNINVWVIFNEIYGVIGQQGGITSFSQTNRDVPFADEIYFIGNIIHDCHSTANDSQAYSTWEQNRVYFINNLAYNCDTGGAFSGDRGTNNRSKVTNETRVVINNIFGKRHQDASTNQFKSFNLGLTGNYDSFDRLVSASNLLYDGIRTPLIKTQWWENNGTYVTWQPYNVSAFKSEFPNKSEGFIDADPLHIDPDNGNFRLKQGSPAIDAGTNAKPYYDRFEQLYGISIYTDFYGNPIVGIQDIGPIEYQ